MITIQNAQVYSLNGEVAHQITYSDGTDVRAVESKGSIIRKEAKVKGVWVLVGKPYRVDHSRVRAAERIKALVASFLEA